MTDFVQNVEYQITLNLHSRTMLAFRYGIAEESDQISGFFIGYEKEGKVTCDSLDEKAKRRKCTFNFHGEPVTAVIEEQMLITVLPRMSSLKTSDANKIAIGFDYALAIEPDIMTMEEIVSWREKYLNANGKINKDSLRRDLKSKSKRSDFRSPMEMLGLPENFFDEVTKLREYVDSQKASRFFSVDVSDPEAVEKFYEEERYLSNLAISEHTLLWEETSDGMQALAEETEYANSEENLSYMEERFGTFNISGNDQNPTKPPPVLGIPFGASPHNYFEGKPCFFHDDCTVTSVKISSREDGYHELHYENDKKRFITVTKQKWIIDKYSAGQRGVWTMELSKNFFVLQQPMD